MLKIERGVIAEELDLWIKPSSQELADMQTSRQLMIKQTAAMKLYLCSKVLFIRGSVPQGGLLMVSGQETIFLSASVG